MKITYTVVLFLIIIISCSESNISKKLKYSSTISLERKKGTRDYYLPQYIVEDNIEKIMAIIEGGNILIQFAKITS